MRKAAYEDYEAPGTKGMSLPYYNTVRRTRKLRTLFTRLLCGSRGSTPTRKDYAAAFALLNSWWDSSGHCVSPWHLRHLLAPIFLSPIFAVTHHLRAAQAFDIHPCTSFSTICWTIQATSLQLFLLAVGLNSSTPAGMVIDSGAVPENASILDHLQVCSCCAYPS